MSPFYPYFVFYCVQIYTDCFILELTGISISFCLDIFCASLCKFSEKYLVAYPPWARMEREIWDVSEELVLPMMVEVSASGSGWTQGRCTSWNLGNSLNSFYNITISHLSYSLG